MKYELLETEHVNPSTGKPLYRIKALRTFARHSGQITECGALGGLVEWDENLSQKGSCWIDYGSSVVDEARVIEDAYIGGTARLTDEAEASGYAHVLGECVISGRAQLMDNCILLNTVTVCDCATVSGHSILFDEAHVCDDARISGYAEMHDRSRLSGTALLCGRRRLYANVSIRDTHLGGDGPITGPLVMTKDPIFISGLGLAVMVTDNHIDVGEWRHPISAWRSADDHFLQSVDPKLATFWVKHGTKILAMVD